LRAGAGPAWGWRTYGKIRSKTVDLLITTSMMVRRRGICHRGFTTVSTKRVKKRRSRGSTKGNRLKRKTGGQRGEIL